jgi:uncharacterized protein (TIGR02145 family)
MPASKDTAQRTRFGVLFLLSIMLLPAMGVGPENVEFMIGDTGSFEHQGTIYTWKVMKDGKKWLTVNLNVEVEHSWTYNDDPKCGEKYGRLYTWEAAKEACSQLGEGWRLPSDEDWKNLAIEYGGYHDWKTGTVVGDPEQAYEALTEEGDSGFSAILAGWRDPAGDFDFLGENGIFWTNSLREESDARGFGFYRGRRMMARGNGSINFGHSVRCIQDE